MTTPVWEPILSTTLTASANVVSFSSISSSYDNLVLIWSGRYDTGASGQYIQFNSDTSTNYAHIRWYSSGTPGFSNAATNLQGFNWLTGDMCCNIVHIYGYKSSKYKQTRIRNTYSMSQMANNSDMWKSTATITSFLIGANNTSLGYDTGTKFALYGLDNS